MLIVLILVAAIVTFAFVAFCKTRDQKGINGTQAFAEASKRGDYWGWLIASILLFVGVVVFLTITYHRDQAWLTGYSVMLFVAVAGLLAGIIALPASIKADPIAYLGTTRTNQLIYEAEIEEASK